MQKVLFYSLLSLLTCQAIAARVPIAKQGMVVSEQKIASQIGADILHAGGNAVDAAVAVGYALAVVNPCCGNIGGSGFMLIHLANGKNIFINFRGKAPLKAHAKMFQDAHGKVIPNTSIKGYLAIDVPGTVLGLDTALQKYGTLQRSKVMAPAILLAQKGYVISDYQAMQFKQFATDFQAQPNLAAIFLKDGHPYQAGERLIQTDLANTLQQISAQGPEVFYRGFIAAAIVSASNAHGGILTMADFANYDVKELPPIYCSYRGYEIISAPPPSSGGITLCEMLNILENFSLKDLGYRSAQSLTYIIDAMRFGFLDRNSKLGDPDFIENPGAQLISKSYAKKLSEKIRQGYDTLLPTSQNSTETTHYSILDNKGNAVSVTYTLNGWFGAVVIADQTGFFLNNDMDDFSLGNNIANQFGLLQSDRNNIQPGKRPLSSMTPTMVMKDGQLFLILGSPGGPRIITSLLLTILNIIDYGMPLQAAINEPRFHYQVSPNFIYTEPFAIDFLAQKKLQWQGYHFQSDNPWSAVEAILIDPKQNKIYGANDIRRPDGGAISG